MNKDTFKPAWWLSSPHLQTIWPTWFKPRIPIAMDWETLELDDGDFINLGWIHHSTPKPIVMLIHGLEGTADSHYVSTILTALYNNGFNTVFMSLRGSGGVPNRLSKSYHSGASDDLRQVLAKLQMRDLHPDAAVGVSLGGNLLLKYLGEEQANTGLKQAVAISVPFDLSACADKLETGFAKRYGKYLLDKLKFSYKAKFSQINNPLTLDIESIKTLRDFDNYITAPLNGFDDAADYYQRCSCKPFLKDIAIPTLIIHSLDDPFMYPHVVPKQDEVSEFVTLEITDKGGHVGFVQGSFPGLARSWLGTTVTKYLQKNRAH